ncbi:MAG: hypothetical protein R3346_03430 [Candidatus Spechtbacterales bacterium]|nr:hypothetical protein [Candidatus Spechtbacterales bacterium]
MTNIIKNKNILLIIVAGIFLFTYTLIAANMVRGEYAVDDLRSDIKNAQKESNELQLKLSEVSSLDFVLEESARLSYEEINHASYIKKPSISPFASR